MTFRLIFSSFKFLAIPACLLFGNMSSHAQNYKDDRSPELNICLDSGEAVAGNMPAIFDCFSAEWDRRSKKLNETYRAVRQALSPVRQKQLQHLERLWIVERDRKCKTAADLDGGVEYHDGKLTWYSCHVLETGRRIDWLKRHAQRLTVSR